MDFSMDPENSFVKEIKIGPLTVPNNVFLAPMAGVADSAFRSLCMEYGAGMCFSEMISAKGVFYKNSGSLELAKHRPSESPFGVQIFGNDPEIMAFAAELFASEYGADLIDINMGCPVPKVCGNREGSFLMTEPRLVEKIVSAAARRIKVPLTVKMRRGFTDDLETAPEIAAVCEASGASAVTVHGRFRSQYYSGASCPDTIRRVKERVKIPVIASGDICSSGDAAEIMKYTGCDGIMIGRAALGRPWIFEEIVRGVQIKKTPELVRSCVERQFAAALRDKGEYTAVREMKKHVAWYLKGQRNGAALRNAAFRAETMEELLAAAGLGGQKKTEKE